MTKTPKLKPLDIMTNVRWAGQTADDATEFLRRTATPKVYSDEVLAAYREGVQKGFLEAVACLVRHGHAAYGK